MLTMQSCVPQSLCLVQVPALSIFETSLRRGKFDANRKLSNGGMLEFAKIYPMDAVFDTPDDVPEDVRTACLQTCHMQLHPSRVTLQLPFPMHLLIGLCSTHMRQRMWGQCTTECSSQLLI